MFIVVLANWSKTTVDHGLLTEKKDHGRSRGQKKTMVKDHLVNDQMVSDRMVILKKRRPPFFSKRPVGPVFF